MLLGSQTLNPRQALNFSGYESFPRFAPLENEQVWFTLVDLKSKEAVKVKGKVKKAAMTLSDADEKNKKISDTGFAWVRI